MTQYGVLLLLVAGLVLTSIGDVLGRIWQTRHDQAGPPPPYDWARDDGFLLGQIHDGEGDVFFPIKWYFRIPGAGTREW